MAHSKLSINGVVILKRWPGQLGKEGGKEASRNSSSLSFHVLRSKSTPLFWDSISSSAIENKWVSQVLLQCRSSQGESRCFFIGRVCWPAEAHGRG